MRRRIALQKHFVRNQGKRLHGFALALGVRTRPRVAFGTYGTTRQAFLQVAVRVWALHRLAIAMRVVDEKVTRGVFQV